MYCACRYDLDPIQGQDQGHGAMTVSPFRAIFNLRAYRVTNLCSFEFSIVEN